MGKTNYKMPNTAMIVDNVGNLYSIIDVLRGNYAPLETGHTNYKIPNTAMFIDADGNLYSLIDLLKEIGSSGSVDLSNYYTKTETYSKDELDTQFSKKANASAVYKRTETYTKAEVDALIDSLRKELSPAPPEETA